MATGRSHALVTGVELLLQGRPACIWACIRRSPRSSAYSMSTGWGRESPVHMSALALVGSVGCVESAVLAVGNPAVAVGGSLDWPPAATRTGHRPARRFGALHAGTGQGSAASVGAVDEVRPLQVAVRKQGGRACRRRPASWPPGAKLVPVMPLLAVNLKRPTTLLSGVKCRQYWWVSSLSVYYSRPLSKNIAPAYGSSVTVLVRLPVTRLGDSREACRHQVCRVQLLACKPRRALRSRVRMPYPR